MRGMRFTVPRPPSSGWLADGSLDWFWAAAERVELPLMVSVPGQPGKIAGSPQRHPRLTFILDHMARPRGLKDDAAFADLDDLLALARHSNVAVKVSSIPSYATESYPFRGLDRYLQRIHEAFGARRMLLGTDYTRLPVPYRDGVRHAAEGMILLRAGDGEWAAARAAADSVGCGI